MLRWWLYSKRMWPTGAYWWTSPNESLLRFEGQILNFWRNFWRLYEQKFSNKLPSFKFISLLSISANWWNVKRLLFTHLSTASISIFNGCYDFPRTILTVFMLISIWSWFFRCVVKNCFSKMNLKNFEKESFRSSNEKERAMPKSKVIIKISWKYF